MNAPALFTVRPPAGTARTAIGRPATTLGTLALALLLAACGGGGGTEIAGVGGGGTGDGPSPGPTPTAQIAPPSNPTPAPVQVAMLKSIVSGPITDPSTLSFEGVRYDPTGALVTDDEGRTRSLAELAAGMIVEVEGRIAPAQSWGVADTIRIVSQVRGPVTAIDLAARTLQVLQSTVRWTRTTAWNASAGAQAIAPGSSVEVWGFVDDETGTIWATRIEIGPPNPPVVNTPAAPPTRADGHIASQPVKIQARVPDTATTPTALRVGSVQVEIGGAPVIGGPLRPGAQVSVIGIPVGGTVRATSIRVPARPRAETIEVAVLDGGIANHVSTASFEVNGFTIDASAAVFHNGSASDLGNRVRVQVVGTLRRGQVVASRVVVGSRMTETTPQLPVDRLDRPGGVAPGAPPPRPGGIAPSAPPPYCGALSEPQLVFMSAGWTYALPHCGAAQIIRVAYSGSRWDASFVIGDPLSGAEVTMRPLTVSAPTTTPMPTAPLIHANQGWRYVFGYDAASWRVDQASFSGASRYSGTFVLRRLSDGVRVEASPVRVDAPQP